MSTWQKINDIIWAIDNLGDPSDLLKPSDSVIKVGWPGGKPNRQHFNWILEECHNNLSFLELNGFPPWDATSTYSTYGIVRYGTKLYISLQTNNTNQNPATETAYWKDFFVWLSEQAGTEQTNQTVANFNAGYYYPHPIYINGTTINLTGDNLLLTDLALYPLDTNPLAITVPTTAANTWYYIYVDIPTGSDIVAGDVSISTTTPTFDYALGMYKSGTKRCIGYIEGNNTGNGEAEPYVVANGWYQRQNKKRRIAYYPSGAPQSNTTIYSGAPDFDGNGNVEIIVSNFEDTNTLAGFAEHPDFSGNINASDVGAYNGSVVNGMAAGTGSVSVSMASAAIVSCDDSSNIIISSQEGGATQDEQMAVYLRKFRLPRGIFS